MDFWKAILGLARRKLVMIPLLGSTIAVGLAGYFLTPLHYVSSTTMVLVPPAMGGTLSQDPTKPTDLTNPMLNFSNNLKTASSILIQAINTPEVAVALGVVKHGPTQLTVDDGRTNPKLLDSNGPFIYVVGDSTSRAEAMDVVLRAQARLRQELVDRQKALGAPPETYLTMVDVVAPASAKVTRAERIKIGGIAFVLSLVLGLSAGYAWQRVRASRHRVEEGELSPALQHTALDASRGGDRHRNLGVAVDEWPTDEATAADTNSIPAAQLMDEGPGGVEDGSTADEQYAAEQYALDELPAEPQVADEEQAAEAERLAEPEHNVYASHEEQTKEGWDLYMVEYPPTQQMTAHRSEDDELDWTLDWSMEGLESEQGSAAVSPQPGM